MDLNFQSGSAWADNISHWPHIDDSDLFSYIWEVKAIYVLAELNPY